MIKNEEKLYNELLELEQALCRIPSPSNKERGRAEYVAEWLRNYGETQIDEADNVIFSRFDNGCDGAMLFCAHLDTVFPDTDPFEPEIRDGRLYCPGAGDDTMNLASMMMLIRQLCESNAEPKVPVVFAADSGEEGLGNLRGTRKLIEKYGKRLAGFVSFDGDCLGVTNGAAGSHRYKITIYTQGGHSYGDFGRANAIAELSKLICGLYSQDVPEKVKTTYNVGVVEGGTSINTIAQKASVLYEYRSEDAECLEIMKRQFEDKLSELRNREDIKVETEIIGIRPCAEGLNQVKEDELTKSAVQSIKSILGEELEVEIGASSTDCNIPLSQGIPAIAFGLYRGEGEHTREEYIELGSIVEGYKIGESFLNNFFIGWGTKKAEF